jgi:hypothetical protein
MLALQPIMFTTGLMFTLALLVRQACGLFVESLGISKSQDLLLILQLLFLPIIATFMSLLQEETMDGYMPNNHIEQYIELLRIHVHI